MRSPGFLLLAALVVAGAGAARAQSGTWTPTGPDGGPVTALAIDPFDAQTVYAGSAGDLFKSSDGGATWRSSAEGLPLAARVLALAVDPRTAGKLYVSVRAHGVFASSDAGAHWAAANTGMETATIHSLQLDPLAGTLFAGAALGNTQPLYRSDDGATWAPTGTGLPAALDVSVAIQAVPQGTTIFAGVPGTGVWRSSNGGATFTLLAGSPFDVIKVMVDPQNPLTLHAITASNGYAQSLTSGLSWNTLDNRIPVGSRSTVDLAVDLAGTLYLASGPAGLPASLYKSTDNAANWNPVNAAPPIQDGSLCADLANPGTLYVATVTLSKTSNGGTTFAAATTGLGVRTMDAVALDAAGNLYAIDGSIFKSTNGGRAWAAINPGLGTAEHALGIAPSAPATIYFGTVFLGSGTPFWGAAHTTGTGTWHTDSGIASDSGPINAIAVDPSNPSLAWLGTEVGGLYKTVNGTTWIHQDALAQTRVRAIVARPGMVHVATGDGVFVSTSGGAAWTSVSSGLTDRSVSALLADPDDPMTLYAGTDGHSAGTPGGLVFRSTDGAASWHLATAGLPLGPCCAGEVRALAMANGVVYLGSHGNGVFRSTDGTTWSDFNRGLRAREVAALAVSRGSPPVVYAATSTGGVQALTEAPLVDGGVGDDASQDAGREDAVVAPDAGTSGDGSGGCGCRMAPAGTGRAPGWWGLLALGLLLAKRSRAASKRS